MVLINNNDIIIDIANEIYEREKHIEVVKNGQSVFYMKEGLKIISTDVPEIVEPQKYIFRDNQFLINENYVEIIMPEENLII